MADSKISQLPVATSALTGNEVFPIVQGAMTKQLNVEDVSRRGFQPPLTLAGTSNDLVEGHCGRWLRTDSTAATTIVVKASASSAIRIGQTFNGVQAGTGKLSITRDPAVQINTPTGYSAVLRGRGSVFGLVKVAADEWDLFGDLEVA